MLMLFRAMILPISLLVSACIFQETNLPTTSVTLDGKQYVVKRTKFTNTSDSTGSEGWIVETVIVDGVEYECEGDCSLTVQRVLDQKKKRAIIKGDNPDTTLPPIDPASGSH